MIAMDGSHRKVRGKKRTGAGIVIKMGMNVVWHGTWGLGRRSNTYNSESFALAAGMSVAKRFMNDDPQIKSITFFSNSSSAISNISLVHTHPSQQLSILFSKHMLELLEGNNNSHMHITWVPGHKGIEINELTDREAKRGC